MKGTEVLGDDLRTGAPWWVPSALTVAVVLAVVVESWSDNDLVADGCYLGVMVGASVAAWIGVHRQVPERRLVPRLIAAGLSLNALGEVIWSALDHAGAQPDVSVADLAWFASYVCLCAALWMVLTRTRADGRADLGFVVDAVTIVVISVLVIWRLTVDTILTDTTVSPLARAVCAAYPVLDAILLALVVRVLMSRSARAAIGPWCALGACLWLAADLLYWQVPDVPAAVTAMDAAWMLAPVLIARAAWRVRDVGSDPTEQHPARASWWGVLLFAVCPLVVPPGLDLISDVSDSPDHPVQLLLGMVAVIALAVVRTGRLIRSEQRAHRELEVARDAALAASEAKSMFLANMSHEIRTPLTTVLVAASLLRETPLEAAQLDLVGRMHRSGERLHALVDGILDFSRIEAGRAVLQEVEFDLHALITDITDAHLPRAQRQNIRLDSEIDPRVPHTVVGDRTRVFQVVNNLVENAVKFSADGQVHLAVVPSAADSVWPHPGVQFAVADTGIGIHKKDLGSVFESFTQVDGSATRRYAGTGLGLAICKELTQLMGGTITVRSELGVGSTFTVRLPLAPPTSPVSLVRSDADDVAA